MRLLGREKNEINTLPNVTRIDKFGLSFDFAQDSSQFGAIQSQLEAAPRFVIIYIHVGAPSLVRKIRGWKPLPHVHLIDLSVYLPISFFMPSSSIVLIPNEFASSSFEPGFSPITT